MLTEERYSETFNPNPFLTDGSTCRWKIAIQRLLTLFSQMEVCVSMEDSYSETFNPFLTDGSMRVDGRVIS